MYENGRLDIIFRKIPVLEVDIYQAKYVKFGGHFENQNQDGGNFQFYKK